MTAQVPDDVMDLFVARRPTTTPRSQKRNSGFLDTISLEFAPETVPPHGAQRFQPSSAHPACSRNFCRGNCNTASQNRQY
jgi:hypothetical protein